MFQFYMTEMYLDTISSNKELQKLKLLSTILANLFDFLGFFPFVFVFLL